MYEHKHNNKDKVYPDNLLAEIDIDNVTPKARTQFGKIMVSDVLPIRETEILQCYYRDNMNLKEIGEKYSVTRERIRQCINLAIRNITECKRFIEMDAYDKIFKLHFTYCGIQKTEFILYVIAHSKKDARFITEINKTDNIAYSLDDKPIIEKINDEEYFSYLHDKLLMQRKMKQVYCLTHGVKIISDY